MRGSRVPAKTSVKAQVGEGADDSEHAQMPSKRQATRTSVVQQPPVCSGTNLLRR